MKAAYLFDEDRPIFDNLIDMSKQPAANKGSSWTTDVNEPPFITNANGKYFEISNNKIFFIRQSDYGGQPNTFRVYTVILRFRVHQLPQKGSHGVLYQTRTVKEMGVFISGTGRVMIGGSKIRSDPNVIVRAGSWYLLKGTYTLFLTSDGPHDCSFGVEVFGVGEFGGDFECNLE